MPVEQLPSGSEAHFILTAVEIVKLLGGLAGLFSACFLIYDRFVRYRPVMVLHRQSYGVNGHTFLRLINRADDDLIVESIACSPNIVGVAYDNGIHAIVEAVIRNPAGPFILAPNSEAQLPLIKLEGASTSSPNVAVKITMKWRRSRHVWFTARTNSFKTTIGFIQALEDARAVGILTETA